MTRYFIEPSTRKYVKGWLFLSFTRKYRKKLLDTGLDALKTASKKLVHKAAAATGEFQELNLRGITKSDDDEIVKPDKNPRNVEGKIILPEKRKEILKRITTNIIKMEHQKISKLTNVSTLSKFVTENESK